jgi:hypothetical protein
MPKEPENPRYFSFLLRIWQEKNKSRLTWRASLENPRDGERLGFSDIQSLLGFLTEITGNDQSWDDVDPET